MFLCDGFRKTDRGIELIANDFQGSIQNTKIEKRKGAYSCLPLFLLTLKGQFKLFIIFIQRMVLPTVILFCTKCFLFVYMYIDLLKPINYLKIVMLTSPGFFFKEANLFILFCSLGSNGYQTVSYTE